MILGAIFGGAGFVGGLCLRIVPFIIFVLVAIAGYVCIGLLEGAAIGAVALDSVVALVASQAGYFVAVLARVMVKKRQKNASASPVDKPEPSTTR